MGKCSHFPSIIGYPVEHALWGILKYLWACDHTGTESNMDLLSWLCNCCSSVLFAAEAPECSGEFRRRSESAAGGGVSAPGAAGVSAQLCDWCNSRQLPGPAAVLHHRVGKVCEEHCSEVYTNILFFFKQAPQTVFFKNLLTSLMVFNLIPPHRKGLRVITESEIGLAAIYASCDQYCNPAGRTPDSGG